MTKLMTPAIQLSLPTIEQANRMTTDELMVKVKYFTPDGSGTWYIVAYDPDTRILHGLCDLGMGTPEMGDVSLAELEQVRGALGLPVERDLYWQPSPLSDLIV